MKTEHYSDRDFLERLYGVGPLDAHLEECAECRRTWEKYSRRRAALLSAAPEIPDALLRDQRRSVLERIRNRPRLFQLEPLPMAAALLLLLAIWTLVRPVPQVAPVVATISGVPRHAETISDAELFQDAYNLATCSAPLAVEPVQSLFEVPQ